MKTTPLSLTLDFVQSQSRRDLLVEILESPTGERLMKAPASTAVRFHHAYEGGLADHIVEVAEFGMRMSSSFNGTKENIEPPSMESIVTVAILHDLGKIGDSRGNAQYVPNILKNGKPSDAIPYEKDKEKCRKFLTTYKEANALLALAEFSDGEASLALLTAIAPTLLANLTESEVNAIRYHDGGYGKAKYAAGYQGKEDLLSIIIHAADMVSSRLRNIVEPTA